MGSIISNSQSAFVKGRYNLDGVVILNESIMEAKKKKMGRTFFKIDFAKHMEKVDEGVFVFSLGKYTGERVVYQRFQNGEGIETRRSNVSFLFLIIAEGLNALVERAIARELLVPAKIGNDKIQLALLQYADDTIFIVDPEERNVTAMRNILLLFQFMSGLAVNFEKSSLMGVGMAEERLRGGRRCLDVEWALSPLAISA
ncbi:uncharacterized protein LOC131009615 [Salvia miltiorrhiza]|uniref:uncharacterized protein LOC131009615 n=1 Tax=Salvia miltiorrhiza TaxID=226208 RepID=UPI0025AB71AD|nr:uncharacterized protein LOC131009615 [Salvia miltiorrhiza]